MGRVTRRNLLGFRVLDCHGEEIGRVVDTWPDDGGWEVELVVVRMLRFGERRMLPVDQVAAWAGTMRAPYSRQQIEDAPVVHGGVHRADDPYRAIAYWRFEETPGAGMVTPPWRRSSGFFATGRPFLMTRNPTPSGS